MKNSEIGNKRKKTGLWILAVLIILIVAVFAFKKITGVTRVAGDDVLPNQIEGR